MRRAMFPGTFDPFTIGHHSIVDRGLQFLDQIVIAIGINNSKRTYYTIEERAKMIRQIYKDQPRVSVLTYDTLTIDFATQIDAAFILRGIRTMNDFEYEKTIADMNRKMSGIETILLFTEPEYACISSTAVRELLHYERDVTSFIPKGMILPKEMNKKIK